MQAKLQLRILQLHEAMGQARSPDLSVIQPRTGVVNTTFFVEVNFSDGISDAELANVVSLCIANIACLKDHLKAWCKVHSKPFEGEVLIDTNREMGIVHDLWNRDKHFDLKRSRSGLFPEIRDISRSARLTTQPQKGSWVAMTLDPVTGQLKTHGDGKVELVIDGTVVDASGTRIGDLLEIAEQAVAAWESALASAGVTIPPR